MSETKWTPGPWAVNPADKTEVVESGAGGRLVAMTPARRYNKHAHDDARLIAAAPELYEALTELSCVARSYLAHMDAEDIAALDAARAALARARGE